MVVSKILDQSSISVKIKKVPTILVWVLETFDSRPVLFGEEIGGIASKHCFLSSGRRGAPRTKNRYQKFQENYTEENRV